MPRRRSGSSGSSKPRSRSPSPQSKPNNTRDAHTAAAPPSAAKSPDMAKSPAAPATGANEGSKPGLLSQMAATAGSVAMGSVIGHGLSSMLFGGGSAAEAEAPEHQQQQQPYSQQTSAAGNCEQQARDFSKCLEKADLQTCSWYLEQLKACQAAASPY